VCEAFVYAEVFWQLSKSTAIAGRQLRWLFIRSLEKIICLVLLIRPEVCNLRYRIVEMFFLLSAKKYRVDSAWQRLSGMQSNKYSFG